MKSIIGFLPSPLSFLVRRPLPIPGSDRKDNGLEVNRQCQTLRRVVSTSDG